MTQKASEAVFCCRSSRQCLCQSSMTTTRYHRPCSSGASRHFFSRDESLMETTGACVEFLMVEQFRVAQRVGQETCSSDGSSRQFPQASPCFFTSAHRFQFRFLSSWTPADNSTFTALADLRQTVPSGSSKNLLASSSSLDERLWSIRLAELLRSKMPKSKQQTSTGAMVPERERAQGFHFHRFFRIRSASSTPPPTSLVRFPSPSPSVGQNPSLNSCQAIPRCLRQSSNVCSICKLGLRRLRTASVPSDKSFEASECLCDRTLIL